MNSIRSHNLTWLKLLAMVAMIWDHAHGGLLAQSENLLVRMPGRIAIPIFAFLIAYSYEKFTANRIGYALRLWIFAALCEPLYIYYFGTVGNAFWPLAVGTTALLIEDALPAQHIIATTGWMALVLAFAWLLQDAQIIPAAVLIYVFRLYLGAKTPTEKTLCLLLSGAVILLLNKLHWHYLLMIPVTLAVILTALQPIPLPRIKLMSKWIGYLFYPLHLILLAAITKI